MPEYINDEAMRAIRAEALARAVKTVKHFNAFNRETVVEVAVLFEDYILNGKQEPPSEL